MSGQGTVGLEIADELDRRRIIPDHLVLNVSGGGLAAGVSEALRNRFETLDISIVEPSGRNKMAHTLSKTTDPYRAPVTSTVMDALAGPTVGKHTRYALARHKPRTLTVSDTQALSAVAAAFSTLRLVVEPGGAAALGAVLACPEIYAGETIVIVASGGNIDETLFMKAITAHR